MSVCDLFAEGFETGGWVVYSVDSGGGIVEFVEC
jgi:hypothetical protein